MGDSIPRKSDPRKTAGRLDGERSTFQPAGRIPVFDVHATTRASSQPAQHQMGLKIVASRVIESRDGVGRAADFLRPAGNSVLRIMLTSEGRDGAPRPEGLADVAAHEVFIRLGVPRCRGRGAVGDRFAAVVSRRKPGRKRAASPGPRRSACP